MRKLFIALTMLAATVSGQQPQGGYPTIRGAVAPGEITVWRSRTEVGSGGAGLTWSNGTLVVTNLSVTGTAILPSPLYFGDIYTGNLYASNSIVLKGSTISNITQTVTTNATDIPSGAAIYAHVFSIVTNPVVQTVDAGDTNNVIVGSAVKSALDGKASTNGIIERTATPRKLAWSLIGQSNAEGFPDGTNRLFSEAFTPMTDAFISYIGQYTSTDTNAINYQTNLVYYDYTYNSEISWGIELPIGHALGNAGYTNYIYKTGIGGASPNTFTNGGTWWKYVTNTYATATNTWSNAPAPSFVVFMRGETGSNDQTQEQSYQERLTTWNSLKTYYGNTNLCFIQTGLPSVYYNNTNGALVEAGAKQLAAEFPNHVFFVETSDIVGMHYDQDEMVEVANRIMVVVNKILAGKQHTINEQFDNIGAKEVIADEGQFREIRYKSRDFEEAVGVVIEDEAEMSGSRINTALSTLSAQAVAANLTAPVYSNECNVIVRFDGSITNTMIGGPIVGNEGISAFEWRYPDVGGYTVLTNNEQAAYYYDITSISNSDLTIAYWYRRDFEPSTNDTVYGYAYHVFWTNGSNPAISIASRMYFLPITSDLNYRHRFNVRGMTLVSDYAHPLNEWHHYAWTLDRNGTNSTASCYVDGVLNVSSNLVGDYSSTEIYTAYTNNVGIGARSYGNARDGACDGALGDFVEYRRVLTPKEIMSLATGQTIRGVE